MSLRGVTHPLSQKHQAPLNTALTSQRDRMITASCVILSVLLIIHTIFIHLWSSKTLDKHLFPVDKINLASQIITITTQVLMAILLVSLTLVTQCIAVDQIMHRRESYSGCEISTYLFQV